MELYFHVDRGMSLEKLERPVTQLERYDFKKESFLSIISPLFDQDFVRSLESIFDEGLSLHGSRYFVGLLRCADPGNFNSFLIEAYFERVRQSRFSDKPSRLQSLFAFDNLSDVVEFAKPQRGHIYKVRPCGLCSRHDMGLLSSSFNAGEMESRAARYWDGKPKSDDESYSPKWEYLLKCPVELLERIAYPGFQ